MKIKTAKKLGYGNLRRTGIERRGWSPMKDSPFADSNGELVTHDRRQILDRRQIETQQPAKKNRRRKLRPVR